MPSKSAVFLVTTTMSWRSAVAAICASAAARGRPARSAAPVEPPPDHRRRLVECQDATGKLPWQKLGHPRLESAAPGTDGKAGHATHDLAQRDRSEEQLERLPSSDPGEDICVRLRPHELADHVRIENESRRAHSSIDRPDERSRSKLTSSPTSGELRKKAISSSPVCAGAEATCASPTAARRRLSSLAAGSKRARQAPDQRDVRRRHGNLDPPHAAPRLPLPVARHAQARCALQRLCHAHALPDRRHRQRYRISARRQAEPASMPGSKEAVRVDVDLEAEVAGQLAPLEPGAQHRRRSISGAAITSRRWR